jgi:hypothetical protein
MCVCLCLCLCVWLFLPLTLLDHPDNKTSVCESTLNPIWAEDFLLHVSAGAAEIASVLIKIKDASQGNVIYIIILYYVFSSQTISVSGVLLILFCMWQNIFDDLIAKHSNEIFVLVCR